MGAHGPPLRHAACSGTTAGYPTLRRGSRGCYVMILQDALSTLGYQTGSRIDGIFGARTEEALKGFQRRTSLRVDGAWLQQLEKISTAVIGVGRTKRRSIDVRQLPKGELFASDGLHS